MTDERNVADRFKNWHLDLIKESISKESFPYAVMMENFAGDFNIGTVIRNANAFGAKTIYYCGKKRFDRRGAVGTYLYKDVVYVDEAQIIELKKEYTFVGFENVPGATKLGKYSWPKNALMIFGEEGIGITPDTLKLCDAVVEIPMFGSVRSLNAGTASGIAMFDYTNRMI